MNEIIISSSNKMVKHLKSLQLKKHRDEHDEFIIEGEKLLREALDNNGAVNTVLFKQNIFGTDKCNELESVLQKRGISYFYVKDSVFQEICETASPQGVIAVAGKMHFNIDEVLNKDELCMVLLHEVRDPGNAGTVIRTADACGLDAVILSQGCVDLYNGKTIRSTMGSLFHIPVIQNLDTCDTVIKLKERNIFTIGADPHGGKSCIELPYYNRAAIIIGNESFGIGEEIKALLDISTKIPMPGRAESLNAGIAASVLMYEFSVRKKCTR